MRNAETIFGAIAKEIEDLGITLLDARAFLDGHLAASGCMTGRSFPIERDYIDHGIHIARECARLDIGQGCVVRKGTVLAVEAFEGTDEMIRRAGGTVERLSPNIPFIPFHPMLPQKLSKLLLKRPLAVMLFLVGNVS